MSKYTVTHCREVWEYFTVEIEAESPEAAEAKISAEDWTDPEETDDLECQGVTVCMIKEVTDG
jgi:hypothetical protein